MKLAIKIVVMLFAAFGLFCLVMMLADVIGPRTYVLYK
jgi:hypothetical protein